MPSCWQHSYIKHDINTGLFEMIVGVLTTCHTQYTRDRSVCILLFNTTTWACGAYGRGDGGV